MYLVRKFLPVSNSLVCLVPLAVRSRSWDELAIKQKLFTTTSNHSTTSEDDWDDMSNLSTSITFSQSPSPPSPETGSIRSTSASGLDLTPNLLVQQMLFNADSKPQKHVTTDEDDDDEYFVSKTPTTLLFPSTTTVTHSL